MPSVTAEAYDTWFRRSRPGVHIGDVSRVWEVTVIAWLDIGWGDFKAGKFNSFSPKYKFVRVQDDAIVGTDVEPLNCLKEALGEIVGSEKRVTNTFGLVVNMGDNLTKSS